MRTIHQWAANVAAAGIGLGFIAFALATTDEPSVTGQANTPPYGSDLQFRAYGPGVACDSCQSAGASPTQGPGSPSATSTAGASSFQVVFLDVGQGDAILVTVGGKRLLIDGGPSRDRLKTRLQSLQVTDLDAILITNPDADHIRGLIEALSLFNIETVYQSGSTNTTQTYADLQAAIAAEPGIQVVTLSRGASIALGGLQLPVLHPNVITGDRNEDSLAVRLTCGAVSVLFMGDATAASEQSMITAGLISNVDVVKAGHHGSTTSSTQQFVQLADAEVVVFSAGLNNQYGHPHAEVVARYVAVGATLLYTDTTAADDSVVMTSNCQTYQFSVVPGGGAQTPTSTPTGTTAASTATATPTKTPSPTPTLSGGYSLPACYSPGVDSCNCGNFSTWAYADWFHYNYDPSDINNLDGDNDGIVCESLPGAP